MPRKNPPLILLLLTLALALAACDLPAPIRTATVTPDLSADYTAAAQTIIAQLTQVAGTLALTPLPASPTAEASPLPPTLTPTAPPPTPTEAPTATSTAPPSPTPPPSPTSPPSDPKDALGNPTFRDTFKSGDNWALYEDDHVAFEVVDSQLEMVAFKPDHWDGWVLTWPDTADFYLEMTAAPKKCSGLDRFGLVFRSTREGDLGYLGYFFGLSCDGRYSLRRWDGEDFINLIGWTASPHLEKGSNQTNRIGVLVNDEQLSLYANGNLMAEVEDDTHSEGKFGVFVGSVNTVEFTALVDEVAYWELP